jgi:hypothetical protein
MMSRKPYRLRQIAKAKLPRHVHNLIKRAENLYKRSRKSLASDTDVLSPTEQYKVRSFVKTVKDITDLHLDKDALAHHFRFKPELLDLINDVIHHGLHLEKMAEDIEAIAQGEPGDFDEEEELSQGVKINISAMVLGDHINDYITPLRKLYAAYYDFERHLQRIAEIGPFTIFLDMGKFDAPQEIIDEAINRNLDAVDQIYRNLQKLNVPDYAIQGPIIFEVGLPPIRYGGTFNIDKNLVRISLHTKEGIALDADYQWRTSSPERRLMEALGMVEWRRSQITLYQTQDYAIIAHELGHRLYYRGLRGKARQAWDEIYQYFGLNDEEIKDLETLVHIRRRLALWKSRVEKMKEMKVTPYIIKQTEKGLERVRNEARQHIASLPKELMDFYALHKQYGYDQPVATFSKIPWPTTYARTDEMEAFAELFVVALFPRALRNLDKRISEEDYQKAIDMFQYIFRSLRPNKPRRYF